LSRSDSWPDFNELAVLPKLKKLSLFSEWSVDFPEFEDFARWANLEYLHLAAISCIWPDISPLADLANLRELELSIVSGELPPNLLRTTKRMVALKKLKINLGNVDNDKTFKLQQRLSESLSGCAVSISQNWVEANW
jgi:hypothetical protein